MPAITVVAYVNLVPVPPSAMLAAAVFMVARGTENRASNASFKENQQ